jgi:FkbM family methyltransferase
MVPIPSANPRDEETIRTFPRFQGDGQGGFITDFLGVRTSVGIFSGFAPYSGMVEGYPVPCNFHANAIEWAGVLRAVAEAGERFVAVELGAGWGPWLITGGFAARQKGIQDIRLVGVEGSAKHLRFMHEHFRNNGFKHEEHTLLHGIAGTYDGTARFPILEDSQDNWGAEAAFQTRMSTPPSQPAGGWKRWLRPAVRAVKRLKARMLGKPSPVSTSVAMEKLPCYSLTTLLKPFERVDLIHIDIQGAEFDVIADARAALRQKVRRMVIGTHGRFIEERLFAELSGQGWSLESDEACAFDEADGTLHMTRDGCQVWRNRRFDNAWGQLATRKAA